MMRNERSSARDFLWLIPVLLAVMWIGARGLNSDALWWDEVFSISAAGGAHYGPRTLPEIWQLSANDTWPPGYWHMLQVWGGLTGWTPYAGRALSVLAGVLAVAWVYRVGRAFDSSMAGTGAAVALGFSVFFGFVEHELRAYTLYALFTTMLIWSYWYLITCPTRPKKAPQWILTLSATALLYTHYFTGILMAVLALYHLLFAPKRRNWWRVVILLGVAGILYAPWFFLYAIPAVKAVADETIRHVGAWAADITLVRLVSWFSSWTVALLALVLFFTLQNRNRRAVWFAFFVGAGWFVLVMVINERLPILYHLRYLMGLWPLLALLFGMGVAQMRRSGLPVLPVLAIWIVAGLIQLPDPLLSEKLRYDIYWQLPWDEVERDMRVHALPGDKLLFLLPEFPSKRYMHEFPADFYLHDEPVDYQLIDPPGMVGEEAFRDEVNNFTSGASYVWVGDDPRQRVEYREEFADILEQNFIQCRRVTQTHRLTLDLYSRIPPAPGYRFGDGVMLSLLDPSLVIINDSLPVLLDWQTTGDVPPGTYSVAIHVENMDGQLVAQDDYGLPLGPQNCYVSDIPLKTLPPGTYRVLAMVYNWQTQERLPAENLDSGETGDRLPLGTIQVKS